MPYCNHKISLIIPTLNAEKYIDKLMSIIRSQTVVPDEVIVIDSESDDATIELCRKYELVKVIEIKRKEFDYGGTKNQAILASKGDIVVMLSQDVTPSHDNYIEQLIRPLLNDETVAACSGRQIAYDSSSLKEKLIRQYNYKDYDFIRDKSDINKLGIKTYFLSDCCSAYRRKAIDTVSLYNTPTLICCDMIITAKLISHGYKIAYAAGAEVYHSHDYTLRVQYKRNFDIGADMEINKNIFMNASAASEGAALARYVVQKLLKKGHIAMAFGFCMDCAVRLKAHYDGKHYKRYSLDQLKRKSANPSYWEKIENL